MKNLGLMVVSLLLAFVVWLFVSAPRREQIRERPVMAPLSIVSLPADLVITTDIPASVTVRVKGRNNDLRALAVATLDVPVEMGWATQPGEVEITLRPQVVVVPPEIEVLSIVPNKIRFRLEQLRQRSVPIRPFLVGTPPDGYLVGEASPQPGEALVSGPSSQVLKLDEVATERIIMSGRTASFVQNVAVVSDSPFVRVISPLTTAVTVPVLAEVGPEPPPPATETEPPADAGREKTNIP